MSSKRVGVSAAVVMLLLSVALYLGIARVFDLGPDESVGQVAPIAWIATLPLLFMMVLLAWLDMRLTRKLKRDLFRKAAAMDKNNPHRSTPSLSDSAARGLAIVLATRARPAASLAQA